MRVQLRGDGVSGDDLAMLVVMWVVWVVIHCPPAVPTWGATLPPSCAYQACHTTPQLSLPGVPHCPPAVPTRRATLPPSCPYQACSWA